MTVTEDVVRDAVTFPRRRLGEPRDMSVEKFDAWLQQVKDEAYNEGWQAGYDYAWED